MTQLAEIRSGLHDLASRRRRARAVDALLVGSAAAAVALFVYYRLDRALTLSVASRMFLDVVLVAGLGWFVLRKLGPSLISREDAIDTALRFERRHGIDADLVAALEFEPALAGVRGEATAYGSTRLTAAVVDDVARSGRDWNFADEPTDAAPRRRRVLLAAVVVLGIVAAAAYPRFTAVFVERLLLASPHYPSNTQIETVTVNGKAVDLATPAAVPLIVPLGRPTVFEVQTAERLPESATVELSGPTGGTASLELAAVADRPHVFRGVLPAAIEDVTGRVVAGDAYTEPFRLRAVPLPTATVTLEVRPPAYAAEAALDVPPPGRLYAAVLEGSDVAVRVDGGNKPLAKVVLTHGETAYSLTSADGGRAWRLDPAKTEFARITKPIEFAIDVVDADGFTLLEPLRGGIALRPDQPPSVTADVVTKFVLPVGKPTIFYQAIDDLGVESLTVELDVQRLDGTTTTDAVPIPLPTDAARTALAGKFPLELVSLQLHKGERVAVRLTARDRRGSDPRATAHSEPFVLEVTDEQGLYEAMAETDQRSALKMDEIIQKQLLLGTGRLTPPAPPRPAPTPPAPTASPSSTPPQGTP